MHQSIGKKNKIIIYLIMLIFLTSLNNKNFSSFIKNIFKINQINIYGISDNLITQIENNLKYLIDTNILFVDKESISSAINSYNFIDSFSVTRKYPSELNFNIEHTVFIAKTIKNNTKYLIGSNGKLISPNAYKENENLPNAFGNFQLKELINFIKILNESNFDVSTITDFYYFDNKRWDIRINNNINIKFPNSNLKNKIQLAKQILNNNEIKKKIIDLRVSNQVIIGNG